MLSFLENFSDLQRDNLVVFTRSLEELAAFLLQYDLSREIAMDAQDQLSDEKKGFFEYFVANNRIQRLYIILSKEEANDKIEDHIGSIIEKLPKKSMVLHSISSEHAALLCKVVYLRVCKLQEFLSKKEELDLSYLLDGQDDILLGEEKELCENIKLGRDLGEIPANILTPGEFSRRVEALPWKHTKVRVLSPEDLSGLGMGLISAVGGGSDNPPYMVLLEHIVDNSQEIIGIIGKGVTFDTGGNQIKPDTAMFEMKGDMGGAAVTLGIMQELDRKNIQKNIVACLCLAENSVSGSSYRPSDILESYLGKTVEVVHTDAEGRLVLADGIEYVGKHYNTSRIISIATLTGACMVALGYRYAGIMGTDESMIQELLTYSKDNAEKYWRLPFDEYLISKTKSELADLKNLDRSVHAGSSMGGTFLSQFLVNDEKYTHIDIAGAYLNGGEAYGKMPKGATGFGVESISLVLQQKLG